MNRGRSLRAVVFDLDGVLWDGEPLYHRAFELVLAPLGHSLSAEDYGQIVGLSVEECWRWTKERFGLSEPLAALIARYDRAVLELLAGPIVPLPGARELVERLRALGVPLAVASSSRRGWVEAVLRGLGLDGAFAAVVTASEVARAKPAPDLYLAAARALGLPPSRCVAIEDTAAGVQAARAACMFVVQVRAASYPFPPLPEADLVLDSLLDFDVALLQTGSPAEGRRP